MATASYSSRLQARFNDEVVNQLQKDLKLANVQQVPRLEKVTINVVTVAKRMKTVTTKL